MKKILVITMNKPGAENQFGVFKRLGVFLSAFKESFVIDFLFFAYPNEIFSENLEESIYKYWKIKSNKVFICKASPNISLNTFSAYFKPIFSPFLIHKYEGVSYTEQITQIEAALSSSSPDVIFAHRLLAMCPLLKIKKSMPPIMFDLDDVEHKLFFREIKSPPLWLSKLLWFFQLPGLMFLEYKAISLARNTFVCSNLDSNYLSRLYCTKRIKTLSNCIAIPKEIVPGNTASMLYLGEFSYNPNAVAANILISEVWPKILKYIPSATLYIAGRNPENIPCYNKKFENVIFTGFVDNLDDLYKKIRVVCCPIFVAGGTRIKIIEAAAYGKAIVSTTIGSEGLQLENGIEIILKDNVDDIAMACIDLLNNNEKAASMGKLAREKIIKDYDKSQVIKIINNLFDAVS